MTSQVFFDDASITAEGFRKRRQLARSLSLAQSPRLADRQLLTRLLSSQPDCTEPALRIGITGTPGVGKSTFIETFGLYAIHNKARTIAVLAVDPSSPRHGGSLLGDRTRMENLSRDSRAFIRPIPSSGLEGGVARGTPEAVLLCEQAGYNTVIVETVGVGQSEYKVAAAVDIFVLLLQPAAGDMLQGIKRGITELADIAVINKADGNLREAAKITEQQYRQAFQLGIENRNIAVLSCSAKEQTGIAAVWEEIFTRFQNRCRDGSLQRNRARQNIERLNQLLGELSLAKLAQNKRLGELRDQLEPLVRAGNLAPYSAAWQITEKIFEGSPQQL